MKIANDMKNNIEKVKPIEMDNEFILLEHRISKVKEAMLIGMSTLDLIRRFSEKEIERNGEMVPNKNFLGVSSRQVYNYMTKAKKEIVQSSLFNKEEQLGKAINRYEVLFKTAMSTNKVKEAIDANKALTALLGLTPEQKLDIHSTNINGNLEISKERMIELKPKFDELIAELSK
jgi:hypothetical protein